MPRRELAVLAAALAVANAAVPAQLAERGSDPACNAVSSALTQYFPGGLASASAFCTSFLSYKASTTTTTSTITPTSATTTVTSTSTSITSLVSTTTTITTSTSTPPTTTTTSTSYCPVSNYNGPNPTKRAAEPWFYYPNNNNNGCNQFSCTRVDPSGSSCAAPGFLTAPALVKVTLDRSLAACRDSCLANSQCQSFSFFNSFGPCQHFGKAIKDMKLWQPSGCANSPLQHFDLSCFSCKQQTTSTPYSVPTANPTPTGIISTGCSCIGATSPAVVTSTATSTAAQSTITKTSTVTTIVTTYTSTSTSTQVVTSTAPAPVATASLTLPNTSSGTYTNSYGDTYEEAPNTDFRGDDLISGECYGPGRGFELDDGTRVPCKNFTGCQDVCSYINANGGYKGRKCGAVTYHPNPMPDGYSTCYLKTGFEVDGSGYCGEVNQGERTDSAVLLSQ